MTRLKLWRLQQNLTQSEAARSLRIGESSLAVLESGRLSPTRGQLHLLRQFFGNATDSLLEPVSEKIEISP